MQAKELSTRMQEGLSHKQIRQAVHLGGAHFQSNGIIRNTLHRVWFVCLALSLQGSEDH